MMRDVRQGLPVMIFCLCELFEPLVHVCKVLGMGLYKALEPACIAPVELDKASAGYSLEDELEINRAHREEKMESQSCPKIHGHVSSGRIGIR